MVEWLSWWQKCVEEVVPSEQTARRWPPKIVWSPLLLNSLKFLLKTSLWSPRTTSFSTIIVWPSVAATLRRSDYNPDRNKLRKEGCIFSHSFRWFKSIMTGKAWWNSSGHSFGECDQSYSHHGRLESREEGQNHNMGRNVQRPAPRHLLQSASAQFLWDLQSPKGWRPMMDG